MMTDFDLPTYFEERTPPRGPAVGGPVIWLEVGERNLDELPDRLCPIGGCPLCSSVWVWYHGVGFSVGRFESARLGGAFDAERFVVRPQFYNVCAVSAVRLVCAGDHSAEFDGTKLVVLPASYWMSPVARMAVLGVAGYLAASYLTSPFLRSL